MKSVKDNNTTLVYAMVALAYLSLAVVVDTLLGGLVALLWDMTGVLPYMSLWNGIGWVGLVALAITAVYLLVNNVIKYIRAVKRAN